MKVIACTKKNDFTEDGYKYWIRAQKVVAF
jgi:hypothetical protein